MRILQSRFSALSRAVVGGTAEAMLVTRRCIGFQCSQSSRGWWNSIYAVLDDADVAVSVLSVEPWLVEPGRLPWASQSLTCFSALSRAVVGGTVGVAVTLLGLWCFSALSRAVVGGTNKSPAASR